MARIVVHCTNPDCNTSYPIDESLLGRRAKCKKCGTRFVLATGDQPDTDAQGQVLLGDFVVERKLGEGGMGTVSLVRSQTSGERFAVKRTRFSDEKSRRNFLTELQTWIDLPEHPHLTACRFFRTVGDEIAVFAEYVDGGSLHDWIRDRKLTRLEDILDVAIQFAWGLHAAHEAGLIHQDVKPGNALVTAERLVKVTDFGLARARGVAGEAQPRAGQSILVSCGGMTAAYCSPEQAARQPLSRKTDVWSWGVSVLEMFAGQVTWRSGAVALKVLEGFIKTGQADGLPHMPTAIAEILRRCLQATPANRWANLEEAAQHLQRTYRTEIGRNYEREKQAPDTSFNQATTADDRRGATGTAWSDPREYLEEALRESGRDSKEVESLLPPRGLTRKAQAIADLTAFEEARQLFQKLIDGGRKDLENRLATLCNDKALVHGRVDDKPGEIALYDQAIVIRERLVHQEGRRELANDLATVFMNKANAVSTLGDNRSAYALYDQAIAIRKRLLYTDNQYEVRPDLAIAYMNKALALAALGDYDFAVSLFDDARNSLESYLEYRPELATIYLNMAKTVGELGHNQRAVSLYDQAIDIWERLVHQEGRNELANDLALVYMNKATAVCALGDNRGAVALNDKAIAILEPLVRQEGRRELANDLALVYMGKAARLNSLGDNHGAVALYDQAIAIRERLVRQEGRRELANDLALVYMNKASAVCALEDNRGAVALYDQAIAIRERLVHQEGRRELLGDLAWVQLLRAKSLLGLSLREQAQGDARAAIPILETELIRTGRVDLKTVLNWARSALSDVL